MNSEKAKQIVRYYYLYKRGFTFACFEQGLTYGNADVIVYDDKFRMIEIEVKVSKSDFSSELKSIDAIKTQSIMGRKGNKYNKHFVYLKKEFRSMGHYYAIPNRFYFAVPYDLKEFAQEKLKDTDYGLLVLYDSWNAEVVKVGKLLHSSPMHIKFITKSFQNLSYENHRLKSELILHREKNKSLQKTLE